MHTMLNAALDGLEADVLARVSMRLGTFHNAWHEAMSEPCAEAFRKLIAEISLATPPGTSGSP